MIDKSKILIVDDKQENLFALENVLKEFDIEVIKAINGNDALKAILNYNFALAVLDVQMPEMDGYELANLIRSEEKTKNIPIIFLSAVYSEEVHVFKGYESGAVDFLTKPYEPKIFLSKVSVFIEIDRHKRDVERHKKQLEKLVQKLKTTNEQLEHEIFRRKKMGDELLKIRKIESIGKFAAGIAHDFNDLLTGILGNISHVKAAVKLGEEAYETLFKAETASLKAKSLSQQLLTFSEGSTPVKKTIFIKKLIEDSTSFALNGSNVETEISISNDLWLVEADEGQIAQVIHGTTINASEAMPKGGKLKVCVENIVLDSECLLPVKEGKYLKISIRDDGKGMSEEHLSKIFDPYFTTKIQADGLGLAICHSIVKNHNGLITAESELNVGTTFYIYLPAIPEKTS